MSKGVAYVKFTKTSDAAAACESLHGSQIGESTRPIKVMIAASKQSGSASSKSRDDEKALRLFIITSKDSTEDNLYQEFSKYGQVDDITILKDRKTRDGKQFAYIRFTK
jgi:RNA recognition motif-containing protein